MADKILEYQNVDGELREIEISLSQSEERKKAAAAQAVLKGANDNIARLDAKAEGLMTKFNALQKTYASLKEAEGEYEGVVATCEDEGELNYIKKKAQSLIDETSALEREIDALSKEIKSVLDEFNKLRADTKKANAQYKEFVPKYNELKASKEEAMNAVRKRLAAMEKEIPKDVVETYKKKRKDKIFPVFYPVKFVGKAVLCGRCGTELPMAAHGSLKKGEYVECDNCHRMLYAEEK